MLNEQCAFSVDADVHLKSMETFFPVAYSPYTTPHPFFSLMIGTLGKEDALYRLLCSLTEQSFTDFEVIVVDQSSGDEIRRLLARFNRLRIRRIQQTPQGVSAARNTALRHATGEWCAFPDDDCYYLPDALARVRAMLATGEYAAISFLVTDGNGRFSAGGFMSRSAQMISRRNVWRCAVSPGIFVARKQLNEIGGFDGALGVGAPTPWQSGEETDLILNLLNLHYPVKYFPDALIVHPIINYHRWQKGYRYGCGMGYVLRKQHYSAFHALYYAAIHVARALVFLARFNWFRSKYHAAMAYGRVYGYIFSKR